MQYLQSTNGILKLEYLINFTPISTIYVKAAKGIGQNLRKHCYPESKIAENDKHNAMIFLNQYDLQHMGTLKTSAGLGFITLLKTNAENLLDYMLESSQIQNWAKYTF